MLNVCIGVKDIDGQLKILNADIKINEEGRYQHEYICINTKNYIRYKVTFQTEDINLNLYKRFDEGYSFVTTPSVDLVGEFKRTGLYPNNEELFQIKKID